MEKITLQQLRRSALKHRFASIMLLLCAAILLTSGAWLITGCTQTKPEPKSQEPQTRPRTVLQNEVNVQTNENAGATNEQEKQPQTKRDEKGSKEKDKAALPPFYAALKERGLKLESVCSKDDPVARRVLEDYGAIFVADKSVMPPPVCMFVSEADVTQYQNDAKFASAIIGGTKIDLQPAAMAALQAARKEAQEQGLDITPRGGSSAARRSYGETLRLWNSRFFPALSYWSGRGRLTHEQVTRLRNLPIHEQVAMVLELEKSGIFFSKDLSKSILYSVAAPGTSQHITMLALDVSQFGSVRVRSILARHGWFQTVKSDLPHFTYLGLEAKDLPAHGLRPVTIGSQQFWIPNIGG